MKKWPLVIFLGACLFFAGLLVGVNLNLKNAPVATAPAQNQNSAAPAPQISEIPTGPETARQDRANLARSKSGLTSEPAPAVSAPTVPAVAAAPSTPAQTTTPATPPIEPAAPAAPAPVQDKTLPYLSPALGDWDNWWGKASWENGVLTLSAIPESTGGGVSLLGANAWTNYIFTAKVNWLKGRTFSVVARRTDDANYISCVFDEQNQNILQVSIIRISASERTTIGQTTIDRSNNSISKNALDVFIKVEQDRVSCGLKTLPVYDDQRLGLLPALWKGGIGFETWDPTYNNSQISVTDIAVKPP